MVISKFVIVLTIKELVQFEKNRFGQNWKCVRNDSIKIGNV